MMDPMSMSMEESLNKMNCHSEKKKFTKVQRKKKFHRIITKTTFLAKSIKREKKSVKEKNHHFSFFSLFMYVLYLLDGTVRQL